MTAKHYDDGLKDRLPANNSSSDIVLNERFSEWEDHIEYNIRARSSSGGGRYKSGKDKKLLKLCKEHADENSTPVTADNIILLTHPFYLQLSHMQYLTDETRRDADEYSDNLIGLLERDIPRDKAGLVVLETLHHYAAVTSLLLENRMIDMVIFTEYDCGVPLNISGLDQFRDKSIFVGGGYNCLCLGDSIRETKEVIRKEEQIWAIHDIILNSPMCNNPTLKPVQAYIGDWCDYLPSSRVITLDETIARLNL